MFPSSSSSCFTASMFNNSPADHASFSQQDPTLLVPHHHQDNFCNNNNNNNGFFNLITNQPTSSSTLLFPNTTTVVPGTPLPPPKPKKKRSLPGNPGTFLPTLIQNPEAEVIALSPKTLLATNRFVCEICKKGFQRDQNLQLHRRGHNLPWKLKQRNPNNKEEPIKKKAYVCPEPSCVHHHPSRALGDLTGIKKHYCRKHGEKKWKCEKCSKIYAVHSDWKAHSKTCGTREYRCDCGTLFSRDISSDEIKQAVFGMGGGKAPGPDGFSGTFFQKYWKIVETDFCGEIKKFFNTGLMPEGWNDTYITLIPKILKPENFSQFRPISCCNYKYKVISKIMSTRLKKWMPTLINELQSAFTGKTAS
ncbi:Protein indeterminate-domain 12 [Linum grandiflorum]